MGASMVAIGGRTTEWAQQGPSASTRAAAPAPSPEMRKLKKAAREFEGILLASVWQAWNQSDRMGNAHDRINDSMTTMGIEMTSIAMAEKGGIGIAKMIVDSLKAEVSGRRKNE